MKNKEFQELIVSIREGGKILRGEIKPARQYTVDKNTQRIKEVSQRALQATECSLKRMCDEQ